MFLDTAGFADGTEGRTRTDKAVKPVDFESTVFTNFTTPA